MKTLGVGGGGGGVLALFLSRIKDPDQKLQNGNEKTGKTSEQRLYKIGNSRNVCISEGPFKHPGTNSGRFSRWAAQTGNWSSSTTYFGFLTITCSFAHICLCKSVLFNNCQFSV